MWKIKETIVVLGMLTVITSIGVKHELAPWNLTLIFVGEHDLIGCLLILNYILVYPPEIWEVKHFSSLSVESI